MLEAIRQQAINIRVRSPLTYRNLSVFLLEYEADSQLRHRTITSRRGRTLRGGPAGGRRGRARRASGRGAMGVTGHHGPLSIRADVPGFR